MNLVIVDTETGEIIKNLEEGDKVVKKRSLEHFRNTIEFNKGDKFVKVFTTALGNLADEEFSATTWRVLFTCIEHLSYETGAIKYENNGEFLTPKDIERESGLSKMSVYRSIDELTDKDILHKGKTGKEFQLFANPFLFTRGLRINKTLYYMFKNTKWVKKHKD